MFGIPNVVDFISHICLQQSLPSNTLLCVVALPCPHLGVGSAALPQCPESGGGGPGHLLASNGTWSQLPCRRHGIWNDRAAQEVLI